MRTPCFLFNSFRAAAAVGFAFLLAVTGTLKAQQDPLYTHYMYNTLSVNPAYAGSRDALSILALGRLQWVGFDGAPMTQTAQIHSPISKGWLWG